jgi:hypothetical protein
VLAFGDPVGDPDGFLREAEGFAALGVRHVHIRAAQPDPAGFVGRAAESVLSRLGQIEPARP